MRPRYWRREPAIVASGPIPWFCTFYNLDTLGTCTWCCIIIPINPLTLGTYPWLLLMTFYKGSDHDLPERTYRWWWEFHLRNVSIYFLLNFFSLFMLFFSHDFFSFFFSFNIYFLLLFAYIVCYFLYVEFFFKFVRMYILSLNCIWFWWKYVVL